MGRISYWSLCDNITICVYFKDIEEFKSYIIKEQKKENTETKDVPDTYALHLYLKQYMKKNYGRLSRYQKFGALNEWLAPIAFVVGILSFIVFLQINGFLWQF